MIAAIATAGLALVAPMSARPAVQSRVAAPQMYDISSYNMIWGFDAKKECFDAWDPEKPRDYENFNPFERNDEGAMCDFNGCFPGQSKGYKSPKRPDTSWAIMQEEAAMMEKLKTDPKFDVSGKPGNWFRKWQDN